MRLKDSTFYGNTSRIGGSAELLVNNASCTSCGSSLATRREKTYVTQSLSTSRTYQVEVFRCRCERVRRIRREVTR
jgi:hypothetical protein